MIRSLATALILAWSMPNVMAVELHALSAQVDGLIEAHLESKGVTPTREVDDYQFARRATLDLAGRTPTLTELSAFVAQTSSDKRIEFVDRLRQFQDRCRRSLGNPLPVRV